MDDPPELPLIGDMTPVPLPVDKYEVESSALTQEIAEKSERFKHWQVNRSTLSFFSVGNFEFFEL